MNKIAILIFPHQLFEWKLYKKKLLTDTQDQHSVFVIEDPLFFSDTEYPTKFHKQKLLLHRASMKYFFDVEIPNQLEKTYVEYNPNYSKTYQFWANFSQVKLFDPHDCILQKRLKSSHPNVLFFRSPNFFNNRLLNDELLKGKKNLFFNSFYIQQRKRLQVLVEDSKPVGGKWSFDAENRKKLPRNYSPDEEGVHTFKHHKNSIPYVKEAIYYVAKRFEDHPGDGATLLYPICRDEAQTWFRSFLDDRLHDFGAYEDAVHTDYSVINHSVLTPSLNIGLLTPQEILTAVIERKNSVPLQSIEGFIRQIIGWREYIRAVYDIQGSKQRTSNFFSHSKKLNENWYTGHTGLPPIDDAIKLLQKTAYVHHIPRLMVLGSVMLLSEVHPDEVYRWFMEMFIDSYDWVMVPNVYGMSQYADEGMIVTKPYISSSNYILNMSNYKKGPWCEIWDGLYWRFVSKHRTLFERNPRMRMMTRYLDNVDSTKLANIIDQAEKFIQKNTA